MEQEVKNLQVAVVDDDETLKNLLEELLSEEGYQVTGFNDGLQIKEAAFQKPFDIILTDINMPNLTGIDLLKYLREELESTAVVIIMTANADIQTAIEAVKLGAFDYLQKPFENISKVVDLVRRAAEKILKDRQQKQMMDAILEKTKKLLSFQKDSFDLQEVFQRIEDLVGHLEETSHVQGEKSLTGNIQEIGLPNLLQMLGMLGKTGMLQISEPDWKADVWFSDGQITVVEMGNVSGEKALFRLFLKKTGKFRFQFTYEPQPPRTIRKSSDYLILNCLQNIDEFQLLGEQVPPPHLHMRLNGKVLSNASKEDQLIMDTILSYSKVQEILDHSPFNDLETIQKLVHFRKAGILDVYLP